MKQRLQKILAHAGVASRRKCEELILQGRITVNNVTIVRLGSQADPAIDEICFDGNPIRTERLEYYLFNKPRGVLSAVSDPLRRPVVTQFVRSSSRLYPAGRLDFQSEGLIVLTNDGELTRRLTQAGKLPKIYQVKVQGQPSQDKLERLSAGIRVEGARLAAQKVRLLDRAPNPWYEVTLEQGRNRQIRIMFERIGHPVRRLRRIAVGPLRLGDLPRGAYRELTPQEVELLRT
tara:strand:+ start:392 stop:1090 length:699 start_codon:yes stop_codon:yes gene_type:complete